MATTAGLLGQSGKLANTHSLLGEDQCFQFSATSRSRFPECMCEFHDWNISNCFSDSINHASLLPLSIRRNDFGACRNLCERKWII